MQKEVCPYCANATIYEELSSGADLSYMHIGNLDPGYNLYLRTGDKRKTAIEISQWSNAYQRNIIIGEYIPKYCPECGRKLIENKD